MPKKKRFSLNKTAIIASAVIFFGSAIVFAAIPPSIFPVNLPPPPPSPIIADLAAFFAAIPPQPAMPSGIRPVVTVNLQIKTGNTFSLSPYSDTTVAVNSGDLITLKWNTSNATGGCDLKAGATPIDISALEGNIISQTVSAGTTFTITCANPLTEPTTATDSVTATIINNPPSAEAGTSHTYSYNIADHIHSGASASDANGNLASYAWSVDCLSICPITLSGNVNGVLAGASAVVPGPTISSSVFGTYKLILTITDGAGNSVEDSVYETAVNDAPVADAGGGNIGSVNQKYTQTGGIASDVNKNLSSYQWSLTSCPSACPQLVNSKTGKPFSSGSLPQGIASVTGLNISFTPTMAGNYTLRLTITDTKGLTGVNDAVILITDSVNPL